MKVCEQNNPRICRECRAISYLVGELPDCDEIEAQGQRNGLLRAFFRPKRVKNIRCGTCRYMKLRLCSGHPEPCDLWTT